MIKVALTNPPFSKLVYGEERSLKSITPCLGLFYLQSYCSDIADIEVFEGEFFDSLEELIATLRDFRPDILGVTTNSTTWPQCARIANEVDAKLKIAGGPYAAFRVRECLTAFDVVMLGDGEASLRQLITTGSKAATHGIAWKGDSDQICENAPVELPALDDLPFPDHSKLALGLYQASPHRELPAPFATMVTTRGCGFRCTFCLSAVGGLNDGRYRERSVENVIREIGILRDSFGVRSIQFWDDTFTMRPARTHKMCTALKGLNVTYVCNTRVDKVDVETADLLAASGCRGVFFGVESGAQSIRDADHQKGVTQEQIVRAVDCCRRAGINTTASFIIGALDDTLETIEESLSFSRSLNSNYVLYNIYTAHPGTLGYDHAVREGIIDDYVVDASKWTGEPVGVPTVCRNVTRDELHRIKNEAYVKFYSVRNTSIKADRLSVYDK